MFEILADFAQNVGLAILWLGGATALGLGALAVLRGFAYVTSWAFSKINEK